METKVYFGKLMQDFNQNRKGRSLRKYCSDEGVDYKWLSEYKRLPSLHAQNSIFVAFPQIWEKGEEGLATIVRDFFHRNPLAYDEAFFFYNKKYDTVKILHYGLNGYVIYQKWFDDGKMLKLKFMEAKRCQRMTRE